ncbi:MAG: tRNA dihydrouridine(20/20a) synthase DusA [Alphaproteobacteria bacterium]
MNSAPNSTPEANNEPLPTISIAPMMDWTDRHFRYFMRKISPNSRLYTEMITTGAILHGDRERFLRFDRSEHPLALQLGGASPHQLAECASIALDYGYDEVNLNCGCPSDRVQSGLFGACLMKTPDLVAEGVEAMIEAVEGKIPITVKCRIGVDELDDAPFLDNFVDKIADKGCKTFILHARKAWLKGLSPKENREIPELNYERVYALKKRRPDLNIQLNGGLTDIDTIREALRHTDGVMIGREAYQNPYFMAEVERKIFGHHSILGREKIARAMVEYAREQNARFGTPIKSITRHILGLYHHQSGAKSWRRALSTLPYEDGADETVILKALQILESSQKQRISA